MKSFKTMLTTQQFSFSESIYSVHSSVPREQKIYFIFFLSLSLSFFLFLLFLSFSLSLSLIAKQEKPSIAVSETHAGAQDLGMMSSGRL